MSILSHQRISKAKAEEHVPVVAVGVAVAAHIVQIIGESGALAIFEIQRQLFSHHIADAGGNGDGEENAAVVRLAGTHEVIGRILEGGASVCRVRCAGEQRTWSGMPRSRRRSASSRACLRPSGDSARSKSLPAGVLGRASACRTRSSSRLMGREC